MQKANIEIDGRLISITGNTAETIAQHIINQIGGAPVTSRSTQTEDGAGMDMPAMNFEKPGSYKREAPVSDEYSMEMPRMY